MIFFFSFLEWKGEHSILGVFGERGGGGVTGITVVVFSMIVQNTNCR